MMNRNSLNQFDMKGLMSFQQVQKMIICCRYFLGYNKRMRCASCLTKDRVTALFDCFRIHKEGYGFSKLEEWIDDGTPLGFIKKWSLLCKRWWASWLWSGRN